MSHSTQPSSRVFESETVHASAERSGVGDLPLTVVYGTDDLPVLIRLPDLTHGATVPTATSASASANESSESSLAGEPETAPSGSRATEGQQRHWRRSVRSRARSKASDMHSWFRGVGQIVVAAVLASVLFAMLVAIRGRQSKTPGKEARAYPATTQSASDQLSGDEILQSTQMSASAEPNAGDRGELQAGYSSAAALPPLAAEVGAPAAASAEPSHNSPVAEAFRETLSNEKRSESFRYPVTNAMPIVAEPAGRDVRPNSGWRETLPSSTYRQAQRPRPQAGVQKPNGSQTNGPTHEKPRPDFY